MRVREPVRARSGRSAGRGRPVPELPREVGEDRDRLGRELGDEREELAEVAPGAAEVYIRVYSRGESRVFLGVFRLVSLPSKQDVAGSNPVARFPGPDMAMISPVARSGVFVSARRMRAR